MLVTVLKPIHAQAEDNWLLAGHAILTSGGMLGATRFLILMMLVLVVLVRPCMVLVELSVRTSVVVVRVIVVTLVEVVVVASRVDVMSTVDVSKSTT